MNTHGQIEVRVERKAQEAMEIVTFELVGLGGQSLPPFSAGAHIDVHVPGGITRQYSLCNDPTETHRYLIGVLRDPQSRGGSRALHDQVQVGDVLSISSPKNHFTLVHDAPNSLLLAGGIGITPLLCMAERLSMTGARFNLHYFSRSPERTAFRTRIASSGFADSVHFYYDTETSEQPFDLATILKTQPPDTHLYVCGPRGFMDTVLFNARSMGWPTSHLHYEFFSGEVTPSGQDGGFEVKVASSGRVVKVGKGETVVAALAAAGVEILTSCEQGVCGTCLTRVLAGKPDHKDSYLTPEERVAEDQFLPCCSRSKSPLLVLDI